MLLKSERNIEKRSQLVNYFGKLKSQKYLLIEKMYLKINLYLRYKKTRIVRVIFYPFFFKSVWNFSSNICHMVIKIPAITGPITNPVIPYNANPPKIERVMTTSGILVSFPTRMGRKMLSTVETIIVPIIKTTPCQISPVRIKNIAVGSKTMVGPTAGMTDRSSMIAPHKSAASTPTI